MIICYICKKNDSTYYSDVCYDCQQNEMISKTDAKKIYKLTNNEIYDANLFSIEIEYKYAYGHKYIISDLENLLIKLTKNCQDSDKRKQIVACL